MNQNKHIDRGGQEATTIFDNRSLEVDYRTLQPLLKKGMQVLDVGCGTGAISKDIANAVGPSGSVIGIDNTAAFIESGKKTYRSIKNLALIHTDLFEYKPTKKFDLIVAARVLQWLNNPLEALVKMKSMLSPNGRISILDYNHEDLEWNPSPPQSMQQFYMTFLKWRQDANMNNQMGKELPSLLEKAGFRAIEKVNANEFYHRGMSDFHSKVGIWSKVASSDQMVKEGYLKEGLRLRAIQDYEEWLSVDAVSMTMKLEEVRAYNS